MRFPILLTSLTFAVSSCDKKSDAKAESISLTPTEAHTAYGEPLDNFPYPVSASDRSAIEKAIGNDGVVVAELDELLEAVNSGVARAEIEAKFGQPDKIDDGIAIYMDSRFNMVIYAGLTGLKSVRIRYAKDDTAIYAGSSGVK